MENSFANSTVIKTRKKVLIITYYWIPSGGAGVQRWVKFVKYLRDFDWEPIVYAPQNPEYPSEDFSFQKDIPADVEIIKTPIWEPYNIYRTFSGRKGQKINAGFISENKKKSLKDKISIWIRGNFLIPDPRFFWVKPSVKFLENYLEKNPVDVIITTGPPHSIHLIGLGLKKIFLSIRWIADFRDPWTKVFYADDFKQLYFARKMQENLEKKVLRKADNVVVVSESMKRDFQNLTKNVPHIIPNGFDEENTENLINNKKIDTKFSIAHIGTLTHNQNPTNLWKSLSKMCNEIEGFQDDLQIKLTGKIDFSVLEEIKSFGLEDKLAVQNYLPHNEVIKMQRTSQVLLLLLVKNREKAKGILTGKFFEYLSAKRPILAVGPTDGDAAKIINETYAGKIIEFHNEDEMYKTLLSFYNLYKAGNLSANTKNIENYTRKNLTGELVKLLEFSITHKNTTE